MTTPTIHPTSTGVICTLSLHDALPILFRRHALYMKAVEATTTNSAASRGVMTPREAALFVVVASTAFMYSAWRLNKIGRASCRERVQITPVEVGCIVGVVIWS